MRGTSTVKGLTDRLRGTLTVKGWTDRAEFIGPSGSAGKKKFQDLHFSNDMTSWRILKKEMSYPIREGLIRINITGKASDNKSQSKLPNNLNHFCNSVGLSETDKS